MAVSEDAEAALAAKFAVMRPHLGERAWRLYLGSEARALGHGGIAAVARAAGVSEMLVAAGVSELEAGAEPMPGRQRRPGGGRKRVEDKDPGLRASLRELAEAATRGDPMAEITWCSLSLRDLERQLAALGFRCGKDALARMLRADGFSLQAMAKVLEGRQHPDRDAQFRHINAQIRQFRDAGDPVVSVDAKKKEQLGPYHRDGRAWRPKGDPVKVRDHDFPDAELGKITPYGVYDIAANTGFVSVGTSRDTAAFAVHALRLWWQKEGSLRYRAARRLLVVCDAGGSNGYRCRLWKDQLAVLAAETGLEITVCHFPPGTSKWNKIEHRLFCHITRTWRARPLMTKEDAVAGIAATTTYQGLKVTAVLDEGDYPDGMKISDERIRHLEDRVIARHGAHGEWNYAIRPAPAGPEPAPPAAPPPGPDLAALAALAGVSDLGALLDAVAVPFAAAREQRLHLDRGSARRKASGGGPRTLPYQAIVTAAACRLRLRMPYRLLGELLGAHESTISLAAGRIIPLLEAHGITPDDRAPRITTLDELREHAATEGIPLTIATARQAAPNHAKCRPPSNATRPKLLTDAAIRAKIIRDNQIRASAVPAAARVPPTMTALKRGAT
jgi:Rhodopirellula transposase DDE domain